MTTTRKICCNYGTYILDLIDSFLATSLVRITKQQKKNLNNRCILTGRNISILISIKEFSAFNTNDHCGRWGRRKNNISTSSTAKNN